MNLSADSFGVVRSQLVPGRLPCRVNPVPLESPQGYLRRVAQTYRYESVKCLANLAGLKSTRGLERDNHAARLAHLLRLDPTEVNSICYMKVTDNYNHSGRLFFGHVIGIDRLNNYKPRICPSCVKSRAVAWGIWDLGLVSACPTHGCLLIDRCPECSNRLSWCRPSVRECRCGSDLGAAKSQPAEPLPMAINAVIYRAAGFPYGGETQVGSAKFPSELTALQLDSLLRAICLLGVIQDPDRPRVYHRRFSADVMAAARLASAASTTLHDWPRSFEKLLETMMAQHTENPVGRSLHGIFGSLYEQLNHVYSSDEFGFIHRAFEEFLAKNWHGKRGRFFSNIARQNSSWLSAKDAAILIQGGKDQLVDLVRRGELEGVIVNAGNLGSRCWIKRESLNRWIEKRGIGSRFLSTQY